LTSTETRGTISCWTPRPNCQSLLRTPQPSSTSGFTRVVATVFPQLRFDHGPHSRFWFGFRKSHCAMRSPLGSVHVRVMLDTRVVAGFLMVYASPDHTPCRYCPMFTLTAVFPLPNRSYTALPRGVRSR